MSLSSTNIQIADIQRVFTLGPDHVQLVTSSFLTTYAGCLLVAGKCADRWGHRRMFLLGVGIFGAGSLGAAMAPGPVWLIAARASQGVGAAITAPAAVALLVRSFPEGASRQRALGVFSAMGAVGFSMGVVIGGFLTHEIGWRGAFLFYVPLSIAVLVLSARVLDPATGSGTRIVRISWLPVVLITGGLTTSVYALGRIGVGPLAEVVIIGSAGLIAIIVFIGTQHRYPAPLLPASLLANHRMKAACFALGASFAGIAGALFLVATDLQSQRGYSALGAGLAFLPQGLAVGIFSTPAARYANQRFAPWLLTGGLAVITVGQLLYTSVHRGEYVIYMLPAALLVGIGIAIVYPAAIALASAAAPSSDQGAASGLLVTCQQAGAAVGVAAVTGIQNVAPGNFVGGPFSLWACAGFSAVGLLGCAMLLLRNRAESPAVGVD